MKKALFFAAMLIAQAASAITIKDGNYKGATDDGQNCYLNVKNESSLFIGLFWDGDGAGFFVKKSSLSGNVLTVSGNADIASAKAKITMANDGTPIEALMGVGKIFQIGYDINCKNLRETTSN